MDDLYREEILSHYKRPHNWGTLERPDLEFEDFNPLCGDQLRVPWPHIICLYRHMSSRRFRPAATRV